MDDNFSQLSELLVATQIASQHLLEHRTDDGYQSLVAGASLLPDDQFTGRLAQLEHSPGGILRQRFQELIEKLITVYSTSDHTFREAIWAYCAEHPEIQACYLRYVAEQAHFVRINRDYSLLERLLVGFSLLDFAATYGHPVGLSISNLSAIGSVHGVDMPKLFHQVAAMSNHKPHPNNRYGYSTSELFLSFSPDFVAPAEVDDLDSDDEE
jgi:hypothetical protein